MKLPIYIPSKATPGKTWRISTTKNYHGLVQGQAVEGIRDGGFFTQVFGVGRSRIERFDTETKRATEAAMICAVAGIIQHLVTIGAIDPNSEERAP